ncbi:MAG: TetR/AcrR family transcriptional regulator [Herbiconiux sp.]|nr:MAG: TetR/AcrR family transcriptional regulator [Herbiconiux sp.]
MPTPPTIQPDDGGMSKPARGVSDEIRRRACTAGPAVGHTDATGTSDPLLTPSGAICDRGGDAMTHMPVAERRSRLLAAAFAVIARTGVSGATTRAIVEEAGMKLASFHYAFESREELMAELVNEVVETQEVVLEVATAADGSLVGTLEQGLLRYFDQVRQDPRRERAMFELTQYAMRSPAMEGFAARQYERYRRLAVQSLDEAATRTGHRWARPLDELAADLVALTDGITLAWLADGDDGRARRTIAFAARAIAAEASPGPERPATTAGTTRTTTRTIRTTRTIGTRGGAA